MLELYQQALEFAYKNISKESWNTDNFHAVVSGKFAELIVRECASKVDSSLRDWLHDNSGGTMGDKLKQHFGVEE